MGRLSADRGGMRWFRLPALDAATGDQPDKFPHPYRIDAAHIDSRRLYPGGEVDDGRTDIRPAGCRRGKEVDTDEFRWERWMKRIE